MKKTKKNEQHKKKKIKVLHFASKMEHTASKVAQTEKNTKNRSPTNRLPNRFLA